MFIGYLHFEHIRDDSSLGDRTGICLSVLLRKITGADTGFRKGGGGGVRVTVKY